MQKMIRPYFQSCVDGFVSRPKSHNRQLSPTDLDLPFLPKHVTFGSLLSQIRLSSVCLSVVCRL